MSLTFTDIVGLETAKQALLVLAVNPALAGVAIAATVGSGKSTLARAFAALLPEDAPFVELPVNVTEDRLLGGLDLEATLATGVRVIERGLLARAHGGVLYVDGLNLLDNSIMAHLMEAMANGAVRVEREGLSAVHPARFVLVGTYDPSDGEVPRGLLDRIGLIVPFAPQTDAHSRAEVVRRNQPRRRGEAERVSYSGCMCQQEQRHMLGRARSLQRAIADASSARNGVRALPRDIFDPIRECASPSTSPHLCGEVMDDETQMLRAMIADARTRLPQVHIQDEQVQALIQTALSLGVEGNRADVFAVQAALAKAALDGRESVDDDDLRLAVRLVLLPRATRLPDADERRETKGEETRGQVDRGNLEDRDESNATVEPQNERLEELLLSAAEAELPKDVLNLPFGMQRRGRSGSRGAALNNRRGRFVRAVEGDPRGNRIALLQTLMAAAPWQKLRMKNEELRIKKADKGTISFSILNSQFSIRPEDVRVKRFRDKAGMLYIFAVDASGSMAINRMREAKGAAIRLLQDAYVHRDQVALIAFRGQRAQVLLQPSQSVERAKRELDVLPTGGGTPLASALFTAWQLAQQARTRGIAQATLVLLTDGRANVSLGSRESGVNNAPVDKAELQQEIQRLAALLRADGIRAIVIDTQANYLSRGEAPKLAEWLGGRYVYLPNARAEQIAKMLA
ncbi:MAG: VWA domain-containing protein [Anaerolineae bacterium]|nr:VWA domain-containing protein [Candidatus Roseilinea sp.]MDW8448747.1 VWA domain-containing protein [Anaerolineae bacterium]